MRVRCVCSRRFSIRLRGGGRLEDLEAENAELKKIIVAMQQVGVSAFPFMNSERVVGESELPSMGTPERGMPGSETRDAVIGIYRSKRGILRRVFQGPGNLRQRAAGVMSQPYYRLPGGRPVHEGTRDWTGTWERLPADEVERRMARLAREPDCETCARCEKTFRYYLHDATCDDCSSYFVCKDCEMLMEGCGICGK